MDARSSSPAWLYPDGALPFLDCFLKVAVIVFLRNTNGLVDATV
jgi:hypothetical protein